MTSRPGASLEKKRLPDQEQALLKQLREEQERSERLRGLLDNLAMMARRTTEGLSLDSILQEAIRLTVSLAGAVAGSVILLDRAGQVTCSILVFPEQKEMAQPQRQQVARRVIESGLAGWVATQRQTALVADTSQDERWLPPHSPEVGYVARSALSVPIVAADTLLGILTLTHSLPGYFGDEHLQLATTTADHIALRLYDDQLYEEERCLAHRQSILYEVLRFVGQVLDPATVAQKAVEAIAQLTAWPVAEILLFDERTSALLVQARAAAFAGNEVGQAVPMQSFAGRAFQTGRTHYLPDTRAQSGSETGSSSTRCELAVPLRRSRRVLGVLDLQSDLVAAFDNDDIMLAESLSEAIALALDNARLYTTVQEELAERRRTEEELWRAKEAAEAANRAKSSFLSNMGHELRTPLNAIIGYSEMLTEELQEGEVPDMAVPLERIHAGGLRLLEIINGVLDLVRMESGKMVPQLEQVDILSLVHDVSAVIASAAYRAQDNLVVDCPTDIGVMRGDLVKLRYILTSLLRNAVKFTEQGTITLSAAREPASTQQEPEVGERICFRVTDTGIGIDPLDLQRIFEPFTQVDDSITRRYGGVGLGLAVSQRFCEMMGGKLTVESKPGHGSSFAVRLPVNAETLERAATADQGKAALPSLAQAGAGPTESSSWEPASIILVIDDDPDARAVITHALSREGFAPISAADGREGLRLARDLRPDVVTLDVLMPGLDGWAVLEMFKADPLLADIPIVVLSVVDEPKVGLELGAAGYLPKPLDVKRLSGLLRRYRRLRSDSAEDKPALPEEVMP